MLPFVIYVVFYSHGGSYVLETYCIGSHFEYLKLATMIVARFETRLELLVIINPLIICGMSNVLGSQIGFIIGK